MTDLATHLFQRETWQTDAACRGLDPALFYVEGRGGATGDLNQLAKNVCASCPVRIACHQAAVDRDERFGIWGGVSFAKNNDDHRELRKALVAACGTRSGYQRHCDRGETACADCLYAERLYRRAHRQLTELGIAS